MDARPTMPEESFELLVRRHRSRVFSLALRMTGSAGDAEEIAQETFLAAWRHLSSFRGESAVGSWLYRICANLCLMRLRRRRLEPIDQDEARDLPGPRFDSDGTLVPSTSLDWAEGAERQALDRELRRAILRATASLPEEHRAVFLLKDLAGLSYEEIARSTRSSVPSVKSRLHRARLAMREAIDAFYGEPGLALAAP